MRRGVLAVALCLGTQLILPTPAQAWWGWWDELSGPKFWGWEIETRLVCFGAEKETTDLDLLASASGQASLADKLFGEVRENLPKNVQPSKELVAGLAALADSGKALADWVKNLTSQNLSLPKPKDPTSSLKPTDPTNPHQLMEVAINLSKEVDKLSKEVDKECTASSQNCEGIRVALEQVRTTLNRVATTLSAAVTRHREGPLRFASAGVALSACSFEKDERRRASLDVTYRLLWSRADTRSDFAGGNEVRLSTFTPGLSWRPLMGIANGKADWIDLGAGAGIYWMTSDGARPGGFDSITGMILEPLRIDVHAPSAFASKPEAWKKVLSAASFRFGLTIFPAGFDANAFGVTARPEQSQQIMGEWVHYVSVFFDPIRAIRLLSNSRPTQ